MIQNKKGVLLLSFMQNLACDFANVSLRYDYFGGTDFSPVGYLEGIFVKEAFRKIAYGKNTKKI